jgi:hypothetical protein
MFQRTLPGFLAALAALGLVTAFSGCADSGPRSCRISGAVTIDGVPVQQGAISFEIVEAGDLPSGAMIVDGRYQAELAPGPKIVRISASNPDPNLGPDEVAPDLVPKKYQDEPLKIDVQSDGVHDFQLTSD